jgi:hypothetical protein
LRRRPSSGVVRYRQEHHFQACTPFRLADVHLRDTLLLAAIYASSHASSSHVVSLQKHGLVVFCRPPCSSRFVEKR